MMAEAQRGISSQTSRRDRRLRKILVLMTGPEQVAEPTEGHDYGIAGFQLLPHPMDVDLDGIRINLLIQREEALG
jgi:hypothetical protein